MLPAREGVRAEPEITVPVDLCTPSGRLSRAAVGWSRRPLHRCNLRGYRGRKKRWEYWCVTTETHLLAITVADLDYLGLADVFFLEYGSRRTVHRTVVTPLAMGFRLPETVAGADVHLDMLGLGIGITEEGRGTRLSAKVRGLRGEILSADIFVELPEGHETLGVVVPWSDDRFQYTSKHNTRPARGHVVTGGVRHAFGPENQAFGCLDFGRGVWPAECAWNWASASGRAGGHVVGLQLGGLWTDGTGMTENALCVDGRLHKLHEDVVFTYDRGRFEAPWRLRTPLSDRVDLELVPFFERESKIHLGVGRSEVHQMFGRFSGTIVTEEGRSLRVSELVGWAEEHRARW